MAECQNLEERGLPELHELLERQEKLLANKLFLQKLPDKGEKIRIYREKIIKIISEKNSIEETCKKLQSLNICFSSNIKKSDVENLEWRKQLSNRDKVECIDSDDDSEPENPLAIIASSTNIKKKIIHLNEKPLITKNDIDDIIHFNNINIEPNNGYAFSKLNGHTQYICEKIKSDNLKLKEKFKPHKTLISDINDPSKEKFFKRGKNWEVTSATPTPSIHGPTKELPIVESLKLQEIQSQQLKKIQIQHASEKLMMRIGKTPEILPQFANRYRYPNEIDSDSDDSDKETSDQEVHDDEDKDGGVVFTICE